MMMRSRTASLLAAALLWAGSHSAAQAKPPDLPKKITITCQPQGKDVLVQVQETPTGSFLFGAGSQSVSWPSVSLQELPTGSYLFGAGTNSDAGLTGSIQLSLAADDPEATDDWDNCPLCAGLESCWHALVHCLTPAAETCTPAAGTKTAAERYTCPYLQQQQAAATQPATPAEAANLMNSVLDNLEKLEKARKLYRKAEHYRHTGRFDTACEYYERAQQLCPGSRFDHLATTRLRQLYAQRAAEAAHDGCEESEVGSSHRKGTPELLPPPHPIPQGNDGPEAGVLLWPALPPVDPQMVDALDRLLILWDDVGPAETLPAEKDEEAAVLPWRSACPEVLLPGLFTFSPSESATPSEELKELLCRFLALAAAGGCAEIDATSPQRPRFHCDLQIGAFALEMTVNNDGHGHLTVGWLPEEASEGAPPKADRCRPPSPSRETRDD